MNTKMKGGMDHESEIFPANRSNSGYRVSVSVVASRCRVLDDLPSWIHDNSERDWKSRCNRDGGTSRLTGTDNGQKTRSNGQGLTCSRAGKAEGSSEPSWGDGGTSRLTGTDNGQKTRSNGQGLTYSSAGKAEGSSGARCGGSCYGASTVSARGSSTSAGADSGRGDATSTGSAIV
jgi:hypothetical protein